MSSGVAKGVNSKQIRSPKAKVLDRICIVVVVVEVKVVC